MPKFLTLLSGGLEGENHANDLTASDSNPLYQQEDEEEYPDYTIDDFDSETGKYIVDLHPKLLLLL